MVYDRTITRFIADDKVVYQWVRREMQLASNVSWAWRHDFEVSAELEIAVNYPVHIW